MNSVGPANLGVISRWLIVLPDCEPANALVASVRPRATHQVPHPSGRPWLLGCLGDTRIAVAETGDAKVAVLGDHGLADADLAPVAARSRTVTDIGPLVNSLAGSAHVVASIAGEVRIQGAVTGFRRVFHTRVEGVTLCSDRADVLAAMSGAALDVERLAVHLLDSPAVHPLAGHSVWRGVDTLPTDHFLVLDSRGRHRITRWWTPPEPNLPMAVGAPALRNALEAAVDVRVRGRERVSTDLGGFDSTALCCLAAQGGAKVVAYTADGHDPLSEDVAWARRTLAAFPDVEHHVIAADDLPLAYQGVEEVDHALDEPSPAAPHCSRYLYIPRRAAAAGSALHLTGFGGDELLAGSPAHLHELVRSHPRLALRNARGFAVQRPWSYKETVRQLFDRRPYGAWLSAAGDHLTAEPLPPETPTLDWGTPPRMPPWVTGDAVAAVRKLVAAAGPGVEPLAPGHGQHIELAALQASARMVRQLDQMAARDGIRLAAPYYDDRVLEAGLAVRPEERITPWQYKPLIVEAMRGCVPDESLRRHTKDGGSHDVEVGLQQHRADLLALCEESRLGQLGLIDAHALREVCSRPLGLLPFDILYQTFTCELWLRSLEPATVPS